MWDAVAALTARAPSLRALCDHRLHLLAAWEAHRSGTGPDPASAAERVLASAIELTAPVVLTAARAAWDGRLVVMKGPEVALRYPARATRPYSDLDVLTPDAPATQRALLAAGFRELGDPALYSGIHHLRPLWLPGTPLTVELHSQPKWPEYLSPPSLAELLDAAVPGRTGVAGIEALRPEHHAIVLAAHSWAHAPLARAGHLVDVAAVLTEADADATAQLARRWGCGEMWGTTRGAIRALLEGGRSLALSTWARHLSASRERTVLAAHAEAWLAPFWAASPRRAPAAALAAMADDLRPSEQESWRAKLARSGMAIAHARRPQSEHDRRLEARA